MNNNSDRGLLGIAVDSNFVSNGYVYLLYTYELQPLTPDDGGRMTSRLDRVQVSPSNVALNRTTILGTRDRTAGSLPRARATRWTAFPPTAPPIRSAGPLGAGRDAVGGKR